MTLKKTLYIAGCALITLFTAAQALAETLEDAWAVALASDQHLQAVRTETVAASEQRAAAKANRMPKLEFDSTFTQLDSTPALDLGALSSLLPIGSAEVFSNDNYVTAGAIFSIPLYTSGLISSAIDASDAAFEANQAQEAATVQDVKLAVAETFVTVLRARRAVEVATRNVASLKAHARDVNNLYRKDLVPRNDLLAVQVSRADAEQKALQASNGLDLASAAYNRALARPLQAAVDIEEVMPSLAAELTSSDSQALFDIARAERTELRALSEQANALQHQAKAQRAQTKPQIGASAGYLYQENEILDDDDIWSAGIGVRWTPFDGGRTRHKAKRLTLQAQAVIEQRANAESLIQLQVRQTWLDVGETQKRLAVTEQAIDQADENLRVAKNRYQNGIGTNTEVLDAETLRTATQSNHNNARYDVALARVRLARAVGLL